MCQDVLGFDKVLMGGEAHPFRRLAIILLDLPAVAVKQPEIILGVGVFTHGERPKFAIGRGVVGPVESGLFLGVIPRVVNKDS